MRPLYFFASPYFRNAIFAVMTISEKRVFVNWQVGQTYTHLQLCKQCIGYHRHANLLGILPKT